MFEVLPLPRIGSQPCVHAGIDRNKHVLFSRSPAHTQFRTYKIILLGNGSFPLTHQNKEQCLLVNLRWEGLEINSAAAKCSPKTMKIFIGFILLDSVL